MEPEIPRTETHDLPDLPALESVQTRGQSASWLIVMTYGGFAIWQAFFIGWLFWRYWQYIGKEGYIAAGVLFALVLWLIARVLTGYTYFATDPNGLTMRGPLLRRFIAWTDVQEAHSKMRGSRTTLMLKTDRGKRAITPGALGSSEGECIVASAWQHLRRLGKADGIALSEPMLKLWEPIPEDVPRELDWGEPAKPIARVGGILGLLLFPALIAVMVLLDPRRSIFYVPILVLFGMMFGKMAILPNLRRLARQVSVRADGIQAKLLFGSAHVPWSSVIAAWWQGSAQASYLCVKSRAPNAEVWLPYTLGSRESEQFILAIIRYLRNAGAPQAVPLPVIVSQDPDFLKQAALSGQRLGLMQRAFLNTLDPAVAKRIQRIYGLEILAVMLGMFGGAAIGFANVPGWIAERIFSAPDTRFFIPSSSLPVAVPLMIGGLAIGGATGELLGYRLAGPYRDVWREYCKVGSGKGKAGRIVLWSCIVLGILAVMSMPLFVCCYTRVTDTGIAMNRPLHFKEQFYPWRQIERIEVRHSTRMNHGQTYEDTRYVVRFSDRTDWAISDEGLPRERETASRATGFLLRKSGGRVVETWKQ